MRALSEWIAGRSLVLLFAWTMLAAGCGDGSSSTAPFQGVVTLKGAPLADATVAILPTKATGPGPFVGTTDSEGKFSLGKVGGDGGVVPGSYRLTITTVKPVPGADESTPPPTQKEIVPQEYLDGSHRVEVPEEGFENRVFTL